METLPIGTISHGTLLIEDLLEAFADALRSVADGDEWTGLLQEARGVKDFDSDEAGDLVDALQDALYEHCPAYCYFGTNEGDGSDFGVWPDIESLQEAVRCREVLGVSDLAEVPNDYAGDVMLVNDHGNVTFGVIADGTFTNHWSIV